MRRVGNTAAQRCRAGRPTPHGAPLQNGGCLLTLADLQLALSSQCRAGVPTPHGVPLHITLAFSRVGNIPQ